MSSQKFRLHSWLGHRVREIGVHLQRLQLQRKDLSIVFCVDGLNDGMSAGLRGYAISDALRELGWRSIVIPKQLEFEQRCRIIEIEKPQVLLLQSCRHPLNRPQLYPNQFCVLDIDDADFVDPARRQDVIDCAKGSQAAIAGSHYVANFLKQYCKQVEIIWTGSQPLNYKEQPAKANPPVIVWACSSPFGYQEEAKIVQEVLTNLPQNIPCQFWLIGVKDFNKGRDFIQPIIEHGIPCKLIPFLPYGKLLNKLKKASIGLAPLLPEKSPFCAGKSFGKILSYLNNNVVVIASNCADHPLFFKDSVNGFLASTISEWTQAIEFLLTNPQTCFEIAEKANSDYIQHLSVQASARKTDTALRTWLHSNQ